MKKFALAAIAVAAFGLSNAPVNAQPDPDPVDDIPPGLEVECGEGGVLDEEGNPTVEPCVNFYVDVEVQPPSSLDVDGFTGVCIGDAPFIGYDIEPQGFEPTQPVQATLTISALDGTVVDTVVVSSLSGSIVWPGASVDAAGNATDWPGWVQTNTGEWVRDPSDEFLRDGLVIDVEVNPSATASVSYPPSTAVCADPPPAPPSTQPLPRTGSGTSLPLQIGAGLLIAGLIMSVATRRRNTATTG